MINKMLFLKTFPLSFCVLLSSAAFSAQSPENLPGLFGPEFTVAFDGDGVGPKKTAEYIGQMKRHLVDNQPEGAKFSYDESAQEFTSPNGWSFRVTNDPGVLEMVMPPMTVEDIRRFKADIQDAIFVSAANVGLFPWDFLGGGHINMDLGIFGQDLLLARNFIADFWNHNELSMGILNYDTENAYPLSLFHEESREKIRALLKEAEDGTLPDNSDGIGRLFHAVNSVLNASLKFDMTTPGKMHDLNFKPTYIEIRSVRPQANADTWFHQTQLFENRINYLRKIRKPIPLKPRVPVRKVIKGRPIDMALTPPVLPREALASFYDYVSEAGLAWQDHRSYIWPDWFRNGELARFEASAWFKAQERKRAKAQSDCGNDLASNIR